MPSMRCRGLLGEGRTWSMATWYTMRSWTGRTTSAACSRSSRVRRGLVADGTENLGRDGRIGMTGEGLIGDAGHVVDRREHLCIVPCGEPAQFTQPVFR